MIHKWQLSGDTIQEVILLKEQKPQKDEKIVVDPFGSYTGVGQNKDERPVQDADDL